MTASYIIIESLAFKNGTEAKSSEESITGCVHDKKAKSSSD